MESGFLSSRAVQSQFRYTQLYLVASYQKKFAGQVPRAIW